MLAEQKVTDSNSVRGTTKTGRLGLFSFKIAQRRVRNIQRALELGIDFFDTANIYSDGMSEEVTGRALREFARRDEIVIAPGKGSNNQGLSRKHILSAIDASLKRLGRFMSISIRSTASAYMNVSNREDAKVPLSSFVQLKGQSTN